MNGAELLCDRLVVMDKGKIAAEGSPHELIQRYSTREVVELRFRGESRPEEVAAELTSRQDGFVRRIEALPDRLLLYTDDGDATALQDRKSTRLNSSHLVISYAVFCLKK